MQQILKRIKKFEQTLGVKDENQGFFVLIRRKKKWLCDEMGLDTGSVVAGEPSEKELALIMPSHIAGPFATREQAIEYLAEELEKIRAADPRRFEGLGLSQRLIQPAGGE